MKPRIGFGPFLLFATLGATAAALVAWKRADLHADQVAAAAQPEPVEVVSAAVTRSAPYQRTTTAVGTVRALQSVTLRNELAGTVRAVGLVPGAVVEAGTLLVALDVSVEEAELAAQEAQVALAESLLARLERARENRGASEADVDRARAEHDVSRAAVERTRAVIARKTLRAPFRARVGLADVHAGQYLSEGAVLTTLQGLDDAVHVDFSISQDVAAGLHEGDTVEVSFEGTSAPATLVALDARIDPATRNALARARLETAGAPLPGASVRVRVPIGPARSAVTVPASALRKGPAGDHVFVLEPDPEGNLRAHERGVRSGALLGDEVVIEEGLAVGASVAAAGSFKLREGVRVIEAEAAR